MVCSLVLITRRVGIRVVSVEVVSGGFQGLLRRFSINLISSSMEVGRFKLISGSSSHLCKLLSALKNLGCSVDTWKIGYCQNIFPK